MFWRCSSPLRPPRHLSIPLPVSRRVFSLSWLLPVYFLFAVAYDVLLTLMEVADSLHIYKHGPLMAANGGPLAPANASSPLWLCRRRRTCVGAKDKDKQASPERTPSAPKTVLHTAFHQRGVVLWVRPPCSRMRWFTERKPRTRTET